MKKRIAALLAAAFAITALVTAGATVTGGETAVQAGNITSRP
ncbi:hypothetical protein ACFW6S_35315 [Streptomyces sp. NPDC058740]